jgi:hypothetical protein
LGLGVIKAGMTIENFTREHFEPHLDKVFKIRLPDQPESEDAPPFVLELIQIDAVNDHRKDSERAPFSLLFRGSSEYQLDQGIYRFEAESGDATFEGIFIVAVGKDSEGRVEYEAVFN